MKFTTLTLLAVLMAAPGLALAQAQVQSASQSQPQAQAPAPDRLQVRSWAASCANCHGTNGRAQPGMASLAGSSREELLRSLLEYKNGVRPATVMHQLAKGYTDEQLATLAGYFASLPREGAQ
ncbi:c-type cytochrome [Roseateles sp.]|uniref:c-type cytochrome n=1 Tax=Roseateles sp. TaxID=1971397 RepID=UPI003BA68FB1